MTEPEVVNVVGMITYQQELGLAALADTFSERDEITSVTYEPEQFPALMYRGADHVMLVFSSGKLLCTGLTDLKSVDKAIEEMVSQIQTLPRL